MTIKHVALSLAIVLGLGAAVAAPAAGQEGPKLYVFTSGSLGGFPKAALQMGAQGNIDWGPGELLCAQTSQGQRYHRHREQRQDN
jgi:N-acyl homoserine lactone hydrolase